MTDSFEPRTDFDRLSPEMKAALTHIVQSSGMARSDVDDTVEDVVDRLRAKGISDDERNNLLSQSAATIRDTLQPLPNVGMKDALRLYDLIWLGTLLHTYSKELLS